jgi:hypothetical protein
LLKVFILQKCCLGDLSIKKEEYPPVSGDIFVHSGWLGVVYNSQATNGIVLKGVGVLSGSPPCFLLVFWESYMTHSRTAMHFFIAIQIRVKVSTYWQ